MQREIRRKERAERDLRNARAEIDTDEAEIRFVKCQNFSGKFYVRLT